MYNKDNKFDLFLKQVKQKARENIPGILIHSGIVLAGYNSGKSINDVVIELFDFHKKEGMGEKNEKTNQHY